MDQLLNKSDSGLYNGDFIDLTDESDLSKVSNEDDDVILVTRPPVNNGPTELNKNVESKKQPTNTVKQKKDSEKVTSMTLVAKDSVICKTPEVNTSLNKAPRTYSQTAKTKKKSLIDMNVAQKQLNASLSGQVLKATNSKNVYLLNNSGINRPLKVQIKELSKASLSSGGVVSNAISFTSQGAKKTSLKSIQVNNEKVPKLVMIPKTIPKQSLAKKATLSQTNYEKLPKNVNAKPTLSSEKNVNRTNYSILGKKVSDPLSGSQTERTSGVFHNLLDAPVLNKNSPLASQIKVRYICTTQETPSKDCHKTPENLTSQNYDDDDVICISDTNQVSEEASAVASISDSTDPPSIAKIASLVASAKTFDGKDVLGASMKGSSPIFLLYKLDSNSDLEALKKVGVNKMLALVPSNSILAPKHSRLVLQNAKTEKLNKSTLQLKPLEKSVDVSKKKDVEISLTKDVNIESPDVVTPVDIMAILEKGKKRDIPTRCRNNEELSDVCLKGFKKTRRSSCISEIKTIIKKEEASISLLKKSLKRYDDHFVECSCPTNYFLPESVNTGIDFEVIDCDNILDPLDDNEYPWTLTEVVSTFNKEASEFKSKKGTKVVQSRSQRTERKIKSVAIANIQNTKKRRNDAKNVEAQFKKPPTPPPVLKKQRRVRKSTNDVQDRIRTQVAKKGKRKETETSVVITDNVKMKKLSFERVTPVSKDRKDVNTTLSGDDLLVVRKVHVIKPTSNMIRVRKMKGISS